MLKITFLHLPNQKSISFFLIFGLILCFGAILSAQDDDGDNRPNAKVKPKKESRMKGETRELDGDWFLTREDHPVKLNAMYFYGNADRETTPVLLLHDIGGKRQDFTPLIDLLVNNGYAVLAPDLRGHGKSTKRYEITQPKIEMKQVTKQRSGNDNRKPKVTYEPTVTEPGSKKLVDYLEEDFQPIDHAMMLRADLPLLHNTLKKVHAEGMCNMNRLVVVGVGRNAALAILWTAQDWKDKESDRFTKTLVLIAPAASGAGNLDFSKPLANNRLLQDNLSVLAAVPKNDSLAMGNAEKIQAGLLGKDMKDEEKASLFRIYPYSNEKTVKDEKGETTTTMSLAECFSSSQSKLGEAVFNFIDKRNKGFKEKENRWTKLK